MYRLASCIALEHDFALLAVAVVICVGGMLVVARLLKRTLGSTRWTRLAWICIAGITAGATVWCTHFVAMLAYHPDVPVSYDPTATIVSLLVAVGGFVAAFGIGSEKGRFAPIVGGVAFGITVVALHYTGMMAVATGAVLTFDPDFVTASVVCSIVFATSAFRYLSRNHGRRALLLGAAILTLTVLSLHLLGMASLEIAPFEGGAGMTIDDATRGPLALAVAGAALLILTTGAVTYVLDNQAETFAKARLRHLSESTVDGMAIVAGGTIIETNAALERMTGLPRETLLGRAMADLLDSVDAPEGELVRAGLRVADGEMLPVELAVRTEAIGAEERPLTVYALRDISDRLAQERRIQFLARYDGLTGLFNRPAFLDEASRILHRAEADTQMALLALDVDHFKDINDSYGHGAGDRVLQEVGRRIALLVGPVHLAARLGGDEFAILCQVPSRRAAFALAEEVVALASGPIRSNGAEIRCTLSVGVAMFPTDGREVNGLLNNADLALYRAKSTEQDHVCFYDPSMDDAVRAQRTLAEDLRRAIAENQLTVSYQVQVAVDGNEPKGFEALVRWTHPSRGFISPGDFIPLAERTGLIVKLGESVMRMACAEAAGWNDDLTISINVSPIQLNDAGFVDSVRATLRDTGIDPGRVEFEVTEHSFIIDQTRAKSVLENVKALGISISIDDFGVGYSSIAMLQAFPFDKIKLDKLFIDKISVDVKARAVLRAVLSLGRALDVPIVAEGVETAEQLAYLREEGCPLVQGYIYGRPMPAIDDRFRAPKRSQAAA